MAVILPFTYAAYLHVIDHVSEEPGCFGHRLQLRKTVAAVFLQFPADHSFDFIVKHSLKLPSFCS